MSHSQDLQGFPDADLRDAAHKDMLLTREELACCWRVCPDTITNYIKQGMPALSVNKTPKIGGKGADLRFKPSACEKWLMARAENAR